MESLNERVQTLATSKVLKEMEETEKNVSSWNVFFAEQCLEAYCPTLNAKARDEVLDMETKYLDHYKLTNVYHPETRIGKPLRIVDLEDCNGHLHHCEFGRIDWYGMRTKNATRYFSFRNDGNITFSKGYLREKMLKRKSRISYDTTYNVLTDEFEMNIVHDHMNLETGDFINYYAVSLKNNILSQKLNGVEVRIDLCSNEREIIIDKKFTNSMLGSLSIEEIEQMIMTMVKRIKGEIPLPGLVERINNYLELMEEEFTVKEPGSTLLTLKAN